MRDESKSDAAPAVPKIVLGLGTTYTGKTWTAGELARYINRPFVIILGIRKDPSFLHHIGVSHTRFVGILSPQVSISTRFLQETRKQYRYLYLSVYDLNPQETAALLESLTCAVKETGNLALFVDEAHLFCSRFQVPASFVGFVRGARHYGVDVILITQRLKDIDVGIRVVLTHLILFRTIDATDLQVLASELSLDRSDIETVRTLPDHQHLFINRRTGSKRLEIG